MYVKDVPFDILWHICKVTYETVAFYAAADRVSATPLLNGSGVSAFWTGMSRSKGRAIKLAAAVRLLFTIQE